MPANEETQFRIRETDRKTEAGAHVVKSSGLEVANVKTFTADTTTDGSAVYAYATTGATVTLTVSSEDIAAGSVIIVKDAGGDASTNAITVDTEGSQNIDGSASQTINTDYGVLRLFADGDKLHTF